MNSILRASTASVLTVVFSFMSIMSGCKSAAPTPPQGSQAAAGPAQSAPPQQMSVDDLVAPIALYPDQLLAQILTASTNAQEVLDGGNWLLQNQNLKGDALTNAAKQTGFGPSMQYLMNFPQVVDNMCQQMDWTRELGQAFETDQKGVMEAIQRKRVQAQQSGNLKSSPQMTIETKEADNGQPYMQIQPANPQVVYVPQYNPVTIYNTPSPSTVVVTQPASPAPVEQSGVSTGAAVAIGLLSFGVGMAVGAAINSNNYYPYPAWGRGGVYYGARPYYPPPYRPVYAGYRPAYGYYPPPNYHWTQYNRNVNVNVNNNYYNRFNSNTLNARNTNLNTINANNRPALGADNRTGGQPGWKGQSTYLGAHPNNMNQKPASMASVNRANRAIGDNKTAPANRPYGGNNVPANRPNLASNPGANRMNQPDIANATPSNRPNAANPSPMNRAAAPANLNRGGDRGYSAAASPARQPQNRGGGSSSAFTTGGSASSERLAGNRGRASMGGRRGR